MKNCLLLLTDKTLLHKRVLIETLNHQLKNLSQIEHTRHPSVWAFFVNLTAELIAYTFRNKLPSLNLHEKTGLPARVF